MACADADRIMLRIEKNEHLNDQWKIELVETIKDYVPECEFYWDANDWRNGRLKTHPSISGNDKWTHFLSSRSKSRKQQHCTTHKSQTLHIVVLSMSASKVLTKYMVLSAIVATLTASEATMQALQVAGFGTLFSAAFIGLIYGEILLLTKRWQNAEDQIILWSSSIRPRKTRSR